MKPYGVLFVCAGNICRSPTAEGVFRHLAREAKAEARFKIESRGTGGWHQGEQAHPQTRKVSMSRGVPIEDHRAKQVRVDDFREFDLIVAMDRENLSNLERFRKHGDAQLILMREYDPDKDDPDVPDPYAGGPDGFEDVFDIVHRSCEALLRDLLDPKK